MSDQARRPSPPGTREILRARARALARRPPPAAAAERLELLEFRLDRESYALETRHVREVCPLRDLTPLPCTPPFVLGIVNVRGRILPVLDIRKFFALPEPGLTDMNRIVRLQGNDLDLGLLADVIAGVRTVAADELRTLPPAPAGIRADYVKGVTRDGLIVLDVERLLADPQIIVHEDVGL